MAGFNFRTRKPIDWVYQAMQDGVPKEMPSLGVRKIEYPTDIWILETPGGGIPAKSGSVLGSADCIPQFINSDGELEEFKDNEGNGFTVKVFNLMSSAVQGNVPIIAARKFGQLVVIAEDCGA